MGKISLFSRGTAPRTGDGVQVNDKKQCFIALLELNPLFYCPQIVANMQVVGRLYGG